MDNGKKNYRFKICILTSAFPRDKGDLSGNFILCLTKELIKRKLGIFVLAPHAPRVKRSEELDKIKVYRFSYFFPFTLQRLCYGSGLPTNMRHSLLARLQLPFYSFFQLFSLMWLVNKERIDIVNSHWMVTQGLNGALIRKIFGLPHILTVHAAGLFALKRFPFGKYIARFIVRNSDRIITVSSFVRSNLDKLIGYNTKAIVCPMGIDTDIFVPKDQAKLREKYKIRREHILLFVGRLVEKKGVEYLIDAMKIVTDRLPDVKLLIIGTGNLEKKLKMKVTKLNLPSYVTFLGVKKHDELIDYFNICDLLIVPSIFDRYGHTETLGMVILEAMSCGKPVIASDIGGIPESVKDGYNGLLTIPKNPVDIAEKIVNALTEFDLKEMGKRARLTARTYRWEEISKRYEKVIKEAFMLDCGIEKNNL
ncbi:glycosyltransferase [bacterium]|nr:glycosyltransferase [bacterium]NIN92559.1 glycosyltransferase [bacterium]NIO18601.1 glycosyltransferase [bacterium]NIO73616.1 glycosyltransferase [bacterium]